MKKIMFVAVSALAVTAFSAPTMAKAPAGGKSLVHDKPVDRKSFAQAVYRKTGGMIEVPGAEKGKIVYVNAATKRVPMDWLESNAAVFRQATKLRIETAEGAFAFPDPNIVGSASLFIVDDEKLPSLLSAPENRWVMVNVAPLAKGDGKKPAFFAARVQKELTRGFSILAGAQSSNYPNSLVGCVTKPEDLDVFLDCKLPVDVMARFVRYVAGYGIEPKQIVSYKKACQEGWAPQPTNDVQKAIWSDVHKLPDKPIKIEYNGKKDK